MCNLKQFKIKFILPFIFFINLASNASAQVRILQWSDAHSTLDTSLQQLLLIDHLSKEFIQQNPDGEVVVLVNGDFTSINHLSEEESGWLTLKSLELLKQKGYTVLFVPGNHDAFDWTEYLDGAELFFQQMSYLHSLGIPILASNIINPRDPLKNFISKSYRLNTLKPETHIVGMTLDMLPQKANLSDAALLRLMDRVADYDETLDSILPKLKKDKVENIILAVHQGHKKLFRLAEAFHNSKPRISHYLGGDDHVVAAYPVKSAWVSDSGSHGSINVIDLNQNAVQMGPVQHYAINTESLNQVDPKLFSGTLNLNPFAHQKYEGLLSTGLVDPLFFEYGSEVENLVEIQEGLGQTILGYTTFGFTISKKDMKKGSNVLGSLIAQSMVDWIQPFIYNEPVIAFTHSGSYKLQRHIQPGPIRVSLIKEISPYKNKSKAYRMTGEEISNLFYSLHQFYKEDDPNKYTPHLNFNTRENNGRLEVFYKGKWSKIKKNKTYVIVFDGWLSTQNYGEGFRIPIWNQIFSRHEPIASEIFQNILIKFFPKTIQDYESSNSCRSYLN